MMINSCRGETALSACIEEAMSRLNSGRIAWHCFGRNARWSVREQFLLVRRAALLPGREGRRRGGMAFRPSRSRPSPPRSRLFSPLPSPTPRLAGQSPERSPAHLPPGPLARANATPATSVRAEWWSRTYCTSDIYKYHKAHVYCLSLHWLFFFNFSF